MGDMADYVNELIEQDYADLDAWRSGRISPEEAMDRAAENGHIEIVKWLHINRKEGCTKNVMDTFSKKYKIN